MKVLGVVAAWVVCGAAWAGGDAGRTVNVKCDGVPTQVVEGVKVKCGPPPVCPPNTTCPDVVKCPPVVTCANDATVQWYKGALETCDHRVEGYREQSFKFEEELAATKQQLWGERKGMWFVPVSLQYVGVGGAAVGLGYQWGNRVSLAGQVVYRAEEDQVLGCRIGCRTCTTSVDGAKMGGQVTVTIPLRGGK